MNTPAHLVLNLALLQRRRLAGCTGWILAGGLLPDLPMFVFFAWEGVWAGLEPRVLWGQAYYDDAWQDFFDLFNSVPLALAGLLLAWRLHSPRGLALCSSMLLHFAFDLPLHHDDGHRHFFPLSDWRFASPVSYWDPRHHGAFGALLEAAVVWLGAASLWVRQRHPLRRAILVGLALLYAAGFLRLYVFEPPAWLS